jgi:hypothetical protein
MIETEVREIPANELGIDLRVQRLFDPKRVQKLASSWDDLMVGVLTVSDRSEAFPVSSGLVAPPEGPTLIVLDGQTRLKAFRAVCGESTSATMTCQVHTGLQLKEEARIFLEHNDRKAVTPLDNFRISLVAEEQWASEIRDIAGHYNWAVSGTGEPGQRKFQAIGAAKRIYNTDEGESFDRTLGVITAAWPREPGTVCGETISGVGGLISGHGGLDLRSLVSKLGLMGFNKFYSSVHDTYRAHPSMSLSKAAYVRTVEIYNSGRKFNSGKRVEI